MAKQAVTASIKSAPECVPSSEARDALTSILKKVKSGNVVYIGTTPKLAYSKFVRPNACPEAFQDDARQVTVDELRKQWKRQREYAEVTGLPVGISSRGQPVAALVATQRALEKKVGPLHDSVDRELRKTLDLILKRLTSIELCIPTADQMTKWQNEAARLKAAATVIANQARQISGDPPLNFDNQ